MARRFKGRRGGSRAGRKTRPRWTANLISGDTTAGGAVDELVLVGPTDYQTSGSLEAECTVKRIRGSYAIVNTSTTLAATMILWVYKTRSGVSALDPANVLNLQSGDVLWMKVINLQALAANTTENSIHGEFDIRSNRILEGGASTLEEQIRFGLSNIVGGGTISYVVGARSLLALNA